MSKEKVTVLGLSCSPRKGGNTELLLDGALQGASEAGATVEKVVVSELDINPCHACEACFDTGVCIQPDDMQVLYPKLLNREAIIIAAPIFFMNLAAQAKALIDRLQCLWAKKFILKEHAVEESVREYRRGLWLSAAGSDKPEVFDYALPTVRAFFDLLEIKDWRCLTYRDIDEKGKVLNVPGGLESAVEMGTWLAHGERSGTHERDDF
ncbi:MAG: flavodoxin family protein [Actinobacteria bacterium]|nr:flavodoxin family protein [Actinomycetota bacterium]